MSSGEFTGSDIWGGRPVARRIADAAHRGRVVVTGKVSHPTVTAAHGTPSYECALDDGTGELWLVFLGRRHLAGVGAGAICTVEGTARLEGRRLVVWNPLYRVEAGAG